jgi:hypothetical protein
MKAFRSTMSAWRMCLPIEQAVWATFAHAPALLPIGANRGQVGSARERLHVEASETFADGADATARRWFLSTL